MTKLNSIIYKKLCAQAEEAKENGMTKLASNVMESIKEGGAQPYEYSYDQLKDDVQKSLWKAAVQVMKYYNVDHADVKLLDKGISIFASKLIEELEEDLGADKIMVGPNEPKVFGEK
jgi:hypothetical protein